MAKHELDLLQNGLDSFNEALAKYRAGEAGDRHAYKFAIVHFAHFLELLFKHYVTKAHPLLIYKNPFSSQLEKQQTIGLWDAVQFLHNEGHPIDPSFKKDLEWLKSLRNSIEHHKFEMEVAEVRSTIGRLTQALLEFHSIDETFDIADHVEPENLDLFKTLSDAYQAEVAAAEKRAEEESDDGEAVLCHECFHQAAAKSESDYKCFYCGSIDVIEACCVCGSDERRSTMSIWNEDGDFICESCEDRIANM